MRTFELNFITSFYFLLTVIPLIPLALTAPAGLFDSTLAQIRPKDTVVVILDNGSSTSHFLTIHLIVVACLLMGTGLLLALCGYTNIRLVMFAAGALTFGFLTWLVLLNVEPSDGYGRHSDTIFLVVSVGVGLVAGVLLAYCWRLAIWLLGGLSGILLGIWILSWKTELISQAWGRILLLSLMSILGVILSVAFDRIAFIFTTSFTGTFGFLCGLDVFLNTGFLMSILYIIDPRHDYNYNANPQALGMVGGVAVLTLIGILIQYWMMRRAHTAYRTAAYNPKNGLDYFIQL
ncbi:uncharacterized protein VTP21DRAFT_5290 [Calcarisporiella thermophila]|uniref:uncharacterized protein n=1 Tax=Calcarisporiella thermophila TaxID=911321 RepID=UPI003742563B